MKKIYLFLLLASVSFTQAFSQNNDDTPTDESSSVSASNSTSSSKETSPNGANTFQLTVRQPLCNVCYRRHLPACKPVPPPTPAPIDGGLSILLAAGIGYGIKRKANRKNQPQ